MTGFALDRLNFSVDFSFTLFSCGQIDNYAIKGKVRVWGTPNHLKWDSGAKNGIKNDSLPKSIKIIKRSIR